MTPDELVKSYFWKAIDTDNTVRQKQLSKIVGDTFLDLYRDILKNNSIEKSFSTINKKTEIQKGIKLFDIDKWTDILAKDTSTWNREFINHVLRRSARNINTSIELSDYEKQIAKLSKNTTSKITTSLGTIEEELKAEISKIVEANPTATKDELLQQFKDTLQHKFQDVLSVSRANTIARTTTTYTSGQGQKIVWNSKGYKMIWLSQRDGDVRPAHDDADGQEQDENGLFHVGGETMETPGGGQLAENNVNCRCGGFPKKMK